MSDHSELKKAAEAATPGPWQAYGTHGRIFVESMHKEAHVVEARPTKQWIHDSAYIAAANPASVLSLIAEVEALREFIIGFAEYDAEIAHAFATMSKGENP